MAASNSFNILYEPKGQHADLPELNYLDAEFQKRISKAAIVKKSNCIFKNELIVEFNRKQKRFWPDPTVSKPKPAIILPLV